MRGGMGGPPTESGQQPARPSTPPGPPSQNALHAAALAHLARFAATEAGLLRVLGRRVDRWARRAAEAGTDASAVATAAAAARVAAAEVARRLTSAGAVDDAAFAAARVRRLLRGGRSRRAIAAHLGAKGVDRATAAAALPDDPETEVDAALAYLRRRRMGAFASPPGSSDGATEVAARLAARLAALAALARAGFNRDAAEAALGLDAETATARLAGRR